VLEEPRVAGPFKQMVEAYGHIDDEVDHAVAGTAEFIVGLAVQVFVIDVDLEASQEVSEPVILVEIAPNIGEVVAALARGDLVPGEGPGEEVGEDGHNVFASLDDNAKPHAVEDVGGAGGGLGEELVDHRVPRLAGSEEMYDG